MENDNNQNQDVEDREEVVQQEQQHQNDDENFNNSTNDDDQQQQQNQEQSSTNNKPTNNKNKNQPIALFVLFQHGSHGRPQALNYLKQRMMSNFVLKCPQIEAVKFFDTRVNSLFASDDGTVICGDRLVKELVPEMQKFADEFEKKNMKLVFDIICLSYGGILCREATFRLQKFHKPLCDRFDFDLYCSIASPHTGVTELPNWKKGLGKFIGWAFSKTYDELLLTDTTLSDYMINDEHINAMKAWNTRLLIANVKSDKLVSFGTSSLLMEDDEKKKQLEETSMSTSTVSGVMNLTAPMNPVADTNTEDADLLAKQVVEQEQGSADSNNNNNNNNDEPVSSPTTLAESASKKESEKDEHAIARKIAKRLRSELDWQVHAVKPDSYFETAHHAVVGSSWLSKPIDDAMDQIGNRLVKPFGGVTVVEKKEQEDIATPANVMMPAPA